LFLLYIYFCFRQWVSGESSCQNSNVAAVEEVMKKGLKKILLITMLLVAVGMMLGASNAAEAKTKTLKTKTIKAGKSVNLKVNGSANWAISNTQVARMTVLSANTAKITGLQPGTTNITAQVGDTSYRATIRVKAGPKSSGGSSSNSVETLSSSPVAGSRDSAYYISTGTEVIGHFDDAYANDIVARTNSYRSSNGASSLGNKSVLTQAARTRAVESAVRFSHTRPNGKSYYTVGGSASSGYKDSPVYGENLAYGYNNASETVTAWIGSASHKENLVRSTFTSIGVGVFWAKQGDGGYVAYIAQEFGS
jgi:uncharacterized protein YkwD